MLLSLTRKKIDELSMVINALDNDPSTAIAINFEATGYEYKNELLQLSVINFRGDIFLIAILNPKNTKSGQKLKRKTE